MAAPYSVDLRERAVAAVERGDASQREIARRFGIDTSTLSRWLRARRRSGSVTPKPHGGGRRPALDDARRERLRMLL